MIIDTLCNLSRYRGLSKNIDAAITFVESVNLSELPLGTTPIDGENVYVNHMHLETSADVQEFEAHLKYLDLHIVLDGEEEIRVADISTLKETQRLLSDDAIFYHGEGSAFQLSAGQFMIVYPNEGHRPKGCVNQPSNVDKIVVKIQQ